jgi:hypothetical protein
MNPDWLNCKACLWWEKKDNSMIFGFCHHSTKNGDDTETEKDWYCEHWTCTNCWHHWNELNFNEDKESYKNHNKCKPVRIEP